MHSIISIKLINLFLFVGHEYVVRLLLQSGADPNSKDLNETGTDDSLTDQGIP